MEICNYCDKATENIYKITKEGKATEYVCSGCLMKLSDEGFLERFKRLLSENKCPFCEKKLRFHEGLLGYESYNCDICGFECDHTGMRFNK